MPKRNAGNAQASQAGKPAAEARQSRRKYARPTLRLYGSVAQLTMTGTGSTSDGGKSMMGSDRRMKEDIVRIGEHPLGIGVYLFRYRAPFRDRWGHGTRFGVIADEVEAVLPQAVARGEDGYSRVDYAMLGVRPSAT